MYCANQRHIFDLTPWSKELACTAAHSTDCVRDTGDVFEFFKVALCAECKLPPPMHPPLTRFNTFRTSLLGSFKTAAGPGMVTLRSCMVKATRPVGQWPSCFAAKSATGFIIAVADVLRIPANKNTEGGEVCQVGNIGGRGEGVGKDTGTKSHPSFFLLSTP